MWNRSRSPTTTSTRASSSLIWSIACVTWSDASSGVLRPRASLGAVSDLQTILVRAADGGRITPDEALEIYRDAPLHALGRAADTARRRRFAETADIATYIIDRNIN